MHELEPFYNWRGYYIAENDPASPFFERQYSEFEYSDAIYNFYIHPQWDNIGSPTLFIKLIYVDYAEGYCIIELMGEWNDAIHNDVMFLKRDIAEVLMQNGVNKFILVGENLLNFHYSDDSYYEEWFDELEDGWIAMLNFRPHVYSDFATAQLDHYFIMGGELQEVEWRTQTPMALYECISSCTQKRLG